eukprot:SAG31_NODE_106_length_24954_cov_17.726413_17_plen_63_part_00
MSKGLNVGLTTMRLLGVGSLEDAIKCATMAGKVVLNRSIYSRSALARVYVQSPPLWHLHALQ